MTMITTTAALADFCARLRGASFITVDTEFMRERTYWPKLCLIQVAGPDLNDPTQVAAIDPLSPELELRPLLELMQDQSIVKVFHAARQDVEIFYNLTSKVPSPLFDTQIAAMVCGFGEQVSYETLCNKLAKATIDKSSRFTDWAARPLSEKQVTYALGDVTHLRIVYQALMEKIVSSNRGEWLDDEMASLLDEKNYIMTPETAWERLRLRHEKPPVLAQAMALAAWRERLAQQQDVPRSRILRDEALMEIAHHPPQDTVALARIRGLSSGFAEGRHGREILAIVAAARTQALPPRLEAPKQGPQPAAAVVELLRVLLKQVAEEHDIASRMIANAEELDRIAAEDHPDIPAMQGWRYELFGKRAQALKRGEIALRIKGRKIETFSLASE
jgi:ribonuclease D